jgi:hypothetical protein
MRCLALLALVTVAACHHEPPAPAITAPFVDRFERASVGPDYKDTSTSAAYTVSGGQLNARHSQNHPLWLRRRLPADAVIELDVKSNSPAGDIKVEAWGDGRHFATDLVGAYTASGYVFIMGGWHNSKSEIGKGNEHAHGMPSRTTPKVELGRVYHWKIARKGAHIDWFVDDMTTPFLSYDDPEPLGGERHAYFGFADWESDLWFDNLEITPQ